MIELALDQRGGLFVAIKVRLLAGHFQVTAAREGTINIFFVDDLLDAINRFERRGVHFLNGFPAVAFDERRDRQLHASEDHTAVSRTGAPAECFGFEHGDVHAAFRERARCGEAAVTAPNDGDVDGIGEIGRGG